MLTRLMGDIQTGDHMNLEETRVRASNLLCKVRINGGGMGRRERRGEARGTKTGRLKGREGMPY